VSFHLSKYYIQMDNIRMYHDRIIQEVIYHNNIHNQTMEQKVEFIHITQLVKPRIRQVIDNMESE